MKVCRFYDKTYQHPASRYARYWNIDESFLWDVYQFFFGEGWSTRHILSYFRRHNIEIKRHRLERYVEACKKYNFAQEIKLKKTQKFNPKLLKNIANRGKSVRKKDTFFEDNI